MSSRKLTYLFLPAMATFLIGIGATMKYLNNEAVPVMFWIVLPFMIMLLGIGIKSKVWQDK